MVDMDKHACRSLADELYKKKLWPESYVTWEFLEAHPRAMEPGYLQINWNTIPGLYNRKRHLRTLVIEKKEWDHLSDPTQLARFWEPTQNPEHFHWTLALALCWTPFHDSPDAQRKNEYVMSITVVRKLSRHDGLPFLTTAEEFRDSANETTHSLLLVWLHRKSLLFPDIYYDRYGHHFTLMHDTGKGYNVGDPQVFLGALLHNAYTSGKGPSPKAKVPLAFLDRPAEHPLIDSCTRVYRDWTKDFLAPAGGKHTLEEHFIWLSTSYQPYTHDPGSPFIPPDFTLGLPPVRDWPHRSGEPPWPLDPKDRPKPKPDLVASADSTGASSPDEGKQRRKKKKHCRPRKAELKVTTRGLGTDNPLWTNTGSARSSSSTASSQSEGDSGLGSNFRVTDTEPRTGAPLQASPDARRGPTDVIEDAPLSDWGNADEDTEMVNAKVIEAERPDDDGGPPSPRHSPEPEEVPEQVPDPLEENLEEVAGEGDPQAPQDPQDDAPQPYRQVLQGFQTVAQTFSAAYSNASANIQQVVWRSLRECTNDDRTFIYGASNAIRHWVESVHPAMAGTETGKDGMEVGKDTKVTKDPTQLLADARKAGQDAIDAVLDLIPEVEHRLPLVYPRIDVASILTISHHHTEEALRNVHTQISDLVRTHVAGPEQAGVIFNTILPITCSFRHQMDDMAINLLFPGSQLVPNVWGARREILEGLSLVAPPSCSASWPASLVEQVTPVPGTSGQSGSSKTPTKPSNPGAGKLTLGSRKKTQPIQQAAGLFWGDKKKREKEEADARAQEEKHQKKPSRPILSLDEHEHSITELTNRAAPSRSAQPSGKTPSSTSKDRVRPRKDPIAVPDPSDDEPLSDQTNKPKAKVCKWDPTPELVVVDDDDSTPLPRRQKTPKKLLPVEEEATEARVQCLKGKARAVQYNLELAALVDYRNKSVPNLKGPPNTDDHSKYL